GAVDPSLVPDHVQAVDIALQPAVVPYACPLKLLDYMAQGRAVIAPDSANIRELVEPEKSALLIPPGDSQALAAAIRRLIDSPAEGARLGAAARQVIEERKLTWEHNAEIIESIAMALLKPGGSPSRQAQTSS